MTSDPARQPRGISTGGQFVTEPRSESGVQLTPRTTASVFRCTGCSLRTTSVGFAERHETHTGHEVAEFEIDTSPQGGWDDTTGAVTDRS